jgi:hypothetical protein
VTGRRAAHRDPFAACSGCRRVQCHPAAGSASRRSRPATDFHASPAAERSAGERHDAAVAVGGLAELVRLADGRLQPVHRAEPASSSEAPHPPPRRLKGCRILVINFWK